ncbi:hypothetical protein [Leptolyngbya ohadii]|uniref:hypothetical protein n=1 Tax=Leptolyngbya ohadii TaxID=1962290 RepID=UPI0034E2526B
MPHTFPVTDRPIGQLQTRDLEVEFASTVEEFVLEAIVWEGELLRLDAKSICSYFLARPFLSV